MVDDWLSVGVLTGLVWAGAAWIRLGVGVLRGGHEQLDALQTYVPVRGRWIRFLAAVVLLFLGSLALLAVTLVLWTATAPG